MYSRKSQYQTKWRDLKDFLTLNQIPKELKQRMQDYFQTMWSLNQGIDIHEVGAAHGMRCSAWSCMRCVLRMVMHEVQRMVMHEVQRMAMHEVRAAHGHA
ncbi:hypothetical protein HAZT_HAZT009238 [Hyalella azteca]|uniref:Uncharacterized protein n=1 Tax=Hyalella azteca TaxID=294128 RepID=A0A6A0HAC9_HYAAZ|nr:hypothetical protein HAZT_HAZT009238 [Hyalella azteca]